MRVMLVDDAALVREGIARLLTDEGVDVVAKFPDSTGLVEAVRADRPTPSSSTSGCRRPTRPRASRRPSSSSTSFPDLGVLVLSQHVETRHAVELLAGRHPGAGYLLKERVTRPSELVDALHRVATGGTVIDPDVVRTVFGTPRRDDPVARLTIKEREVLAPLAEGYSNDRIADRLVVATRTVETHTSRIFAKLGLAADPTTHRRVLAVLAHLRAGTSPLA